MNDENKKALVRRFFDIFAERDEAAVLAAMTPTPRWLFWGDPFEGSDGVREILSAARELYREGSTERTYHAQYVDGNVVISQNTMKAITWKGDAYENRYVTFTHLEGEKVAMVEEYLDTAYANQKFAGWRE